MSQDTQDFSCSCVQTSLLAEVSNLYEVLKVSFLALHTPPSPILSKKEEL